MIVYHGTPFGGDRAGVARFLQGRHALIPFPRQEDLAIAADCCQSMIFDNGAFTAWKQGNPVTDWSGYYTWCDEWHRHPSFSFAIIPDVIDGSESDNDFLIREWPNHLPGVPVWHMHESVDRLESLATGWPRICLGSSGEYASPGTPKWWARIIQAMDAICDERGRPRCRLHGLRMADREIVARIPFASVDSTNVAQNASLLPRFGGYCPPQRWQRAECIAYRMEANETASEWNRKQWQCDEGRQLAFDGFGPEAEGGM